MAIKIGYEDVQANSGNAGQLNVINGIGATGINLTTIASLGASQVVFLEQPFTGYHGNDFINNFSNVQTFMNNGGVMVLSDNYQGGSEWQPYQPHDENGVSFANNNGPIRIGPGGTLNTAIYFSHTPVFWVSHGFLDIDDVQDTETAFLMNALDPGHAVMSLHSTGKGYGISTAIPLDYFLGGSGSSIENTTIFSLSENTLNYAATLYKLPEVDLTSAADNFTGSKKADDIFGNDGTDTLNGSNGNDIIHGGNGDDTINGGIGDDIAWGDANNDSIAGAAGNDQLWGGAGDDTVAGGKGDDFLVGGTGKDRVVGSAGNDHLFGNDGNDELDGGDGADFLEGGGGRDSLTGGADIDNFMFTPGDSGIGAAAHDTITDFVHATDHIDLSEYAGVSFNASFTGVVDQVVISSVAGGNLVQIDVNGDTVADQEIVVLTVGGVHNVDSSDFYI